MEHTNHSGSPYPLGATVSPYGVNFAIQAPHANNVTVWIKWDATWKSYQLTARTYGIWHILIPEAQAGQLYGYRIDGDWEPASGKWYNPHKFLLDPYTKKIHGNLIDTNRALAYDPQSPSALSTVDSRDYVPLGVITDDSIKAHSAPLSIPWEETIIYEAHLGSLSAKNLNLPENIRGTYLGACHSDTIAHLQGLNITTIEFLPLQACITEPLLLQRAMRNHWGYSTGAFFAPDPRYASKAGAELEEFAHMVDIYHAQGIEVIMDVVYNHTCESDKLGTTISWRGIDAQAYYLIDDNGDFINFTGTGNTLDCNSPLVVNMIVDSLRYWAETMAIDGFRFDLAPILGRGSPRISPAPPQSFTPRGATLAAILADPLLRTRKLIAEPWDVTGEGYQIGNFPACWSEWNDHFRDVTRQFWINRSTSGDLATRITGSADIFQQNHSNPFASINFITAHDGFTLADVVSYAQKHNDLNGEKNRDGTTNNNSINHGYEGKTDSQPILLERNLHQRNLLATLLLSTGTPMLLMGDETGHSQAGNNNAYCVPVDASAAEAYAIDWDGIDHDLYHFTSHIIHTRSQSSIFHRDTFFTGRIDDHQADLIWFDPTGKEMSSKKWSEYPRTLIAWINGNATTSTGKQTSPNHNDWYMIFHNAGELCITISELRDQYSTDTALDWELIVDTRAVRGKPEAPCIISSGDQLTLQQPCVLVFQKK